MFVEFCLPVYNEEKILKDNILYLYEYCRKQNYNFGWKIVIVINGSTDNSLRISQKLEESYPNYISCVNIKKPGRGQAIKKYWLSSKADIVSYMDVDLAVSLNNIEDLILPIVQNQADMVIGSRLLSDSSIKRSFIREFISQSHIFISKVILNHHFSDLQCGFKAIKSSAFKKISPNIKDNKWFFDTEIIIFTKHFGYKIKEIPVDWSENRYDQRESKVNLITDSLRAFKNLLFLKLKLVFK